MSLAVLTLSPYTGYSNWFKYSDKKKMHMVMQIIGATLAITGTGIVIETRFAFRRNAHGICGKIKRVFVASNTFMII